MKSLLFSSALFVACVCASTAALAHDRDIDCDDSGYCTRPDDMRSDDSRYDRHWWARYDDERDEYARPHHVCDPDGDRCYLSRSWRWDYREYYRRHGYHWQD